jgi:hypothetical protein
VADPKTKAQTIERIKSGTDNPDPGFTNPGAPIRQRKVVITSEQLLIDHETRRDYTQITLDVIILPSPPKLN